MRPFCKVAAARGARTEPGRATEDTCSVVASGKFHSNFAIAAVPVIPALEIRGLVPLTLTIVFEPAGTLKT